MDQYFHRMQSLTTNKELPSRIRFLLQNTVEMRENKWAARKAYSENGPKTISQVRQDAVKVSLPRPLWGELSENEQYTNLVVHNLPLSSEFD